MDVASTTAGTRPAAPPSASESVLEPAFLDASRTRDHERWVELWWDWPSRDIMAHPDYVRLFARPEDRAMAAIFRTAGGGILYPFLLRPLAAEPWAPPESGSCDLATPYGYGGPFAWGLRPGEAGRFWNRFDTWAIAQGVTTSFARLSLFSEQLLPWNGDVVPSGPNVVRHVDLSNEALWNDYRQEARKYITRAREAGVRIVFDPAGKKLAEFQEIYTATMDRRNASERYYFPREFFDRFIASLSGHFTFVHAILGQRVLSSEILLFSQEHAYSYLGGTLPEGFPVGANYLLKNESFKYCRDMGIGAVVLGGGYQPNDGILRYKRHFGLSGERPFLLGQRTYDAEAAGQLLDRRRSWEAAQGRRWSPASGYFPHYRS
ncbi:MAG TPA: GNAT family N-acetyltransferase [Planctomycetota bacterium]|nr:GNAT family N-acetyltransferase [Planctomycetota bacterium]